MTKHSTMMLHSSRVELKGSVDNVQASLDTSRRYDQHYYEIYADRTGANVERIKDMAHRDVHFNAMEALDVGLVDAVID